VPCTDHATQKYQNLHRKNADFGFRQAEPCMIGSHHKIAWRLADRCGTSSTSASPLASFIRKRDDRGTRVESETTRTRARVAALVGLAIGAIAAASILGQIATHPKAASCLRDNPASTSGLRCNALL
jgi:hypothetical protein